MILDIIVILIIAVSAAAAFRSGFVYSFVHTVGWLLAIVLGFVGAPYVRDFLLEKTDLYDSLFDRVQSIVFEGAADRLSFVETLPKMISDGLSSAAGHVTYTAAVSISDFLFITLSFLAVVIIVKLILFVIVELFSRRNRSGFTGFFDGLLGGVCGLIRGFVIVFILLALMLPAMNLFDADIAAWLAQQLDASTVAKDLYDNNLILVIVQDFLAR